MDNRAIGVFDSGVGGLSVLNKLLKMLPNENYVYIGDTLRIPYGTKTPDEIRKYSLECIKYISKKNLKAVVIACNTVSTHGMDNLIKNFDIPIIGVVEPGSIDAVNVTKNKKIGIVATDATVKGALYQKLITNLDNKCTVKAVAATDLVVTIESGHGNDEIGKSVIKKYLEEMKDFDYDTLIFGCTHYPLSKETFKKVYKEANREVFLVDPAYNTSLKLMEVLKENDSFSSNTEGSLTFYVTKDTENFKKLALEFTKLPEEKVNPILVNVNEE